jgi:hypothetical protein
MHNFTGDMTHLRSVSHSIKLDPNELWSGISAKECCLEIDARKILRSLKLKPRPTKLRLGQAQLPAV